MEPNENETRSGRKEVIYRKGAGLTQITTKSVKVAVKEIPGVLLEILSKLLRKHNFRIAGRKQ